MGVSPACAATYDYIIRKIERDKPDLVILSAHHLTWTPVWDDWLPQILNREYLRLGQSAPRRMITSLLPESLQIDDPLRWTSAAFGVPY